MFRQLRNLIAAINGGYARGGVVKGTVSEDCVGCQCCQQAIAAGAMTASCLVCMSVWHRATNLAAAPQQPVRMTDADLTLRELQTTLPWTIRYSRDFRASPAAHKDFAHALHHVSKAAGKLHALADDMDHDRAVADDPTLRSSYGKYVADLVVCALRLANTFPGGVLDLQREAQARIEDKNGVSLSRQQRAPNAAAAQPVGGVRCPYGVSAQLILHWHADVLRCLEDVSTEMRARGRGDERFQCLINRMPEYALRAVLQHHDLQDATSSERPPAA